MAVAMRDRPTDGGTDRASLQRRVGDFGEVVAPGRGGVIRVSD